MKSYSSLFCVCIKMQISLIIILSILSPNVFSDEVAIENYCSSRESAKIVSFTVTDCKALPCRFVHNKVYTAALTYTPSRNSSNVKIRCSSVLYGQQSSVAEFDGCDGLTDDRKCPLIAGLPYTYKKSVKIAPVPPGMYNVACDIIDDGGAKIICTRGNAEIVIW